MNGELPPGKTAIIKWMEDVAESVPYPERLRRFLDYVGVGEYVVGLEGVLSNIQVIGWSNTQIDRYARQLEEACELANNDPNPEYLSEGKISEFVDVFKSAAGYKSVR